ncbi:cytidylyltransferase domain-containing protein [Desulfocurvus vexinensis]|uniref:acylneuraminate cytidylyltransferase family protein n=1 Tax=Desulfocurvus vexinensis TaxID=399548 RepID=UPI0004B24B41|nr:acylneuraminate cytidylyltransferase family protein [Desulfocurvus vexinensis]
MTRPDPQPAPAAAPPVLALIPARGGSKGIPRKNVAPLAGLPLIAYSILVARAATLVDRVVVSTDDPDIAARAREFGAEAPFLRPAELSGDRATPGTCVPHALAELGRQGYHPAVVAVLYPTHPFRTPALVDHLVARNLDGFETVFTARRFTPHGGGPARYRSLGTYDGAAMARTGRGSYCHVLDDPAMLIDIDTPGDLALAGQVIARGLFDFGCEGLWTR